MSLFNHPRHARVVSALLALAVPLCGAVAQQHPTLHVSDRWKECSIQLDPALSQRAWRQFTREAGLVAYFRPLTDAQPLGRGHVEASLLQWRTGIDDHTAAWNDTFVHPNDTHWLFEDEHGLAFPGLAVRAGVTSRLDVGAYYTQNPDANYGFVAVQAQYNALHDARRNWDVAARVSVISLFGPDDVQHRTYGADALVSRRYRLRSWASISPYAGVSTYLSQSHETSRVVDLKDELAGGTQAMIGAAISVSHVRLGAEFNSARVNSRSLKVGVGF